MRISSGLISILVWIEVSYMDKKMLPIPMGKNRDIIEYNGTTNNLADVIYIYGLNGIFNGI
jgi:hypothetical protein